MHLGNSTHWFALPSRYNHLPKQSPLRCDCSSYRQYRGFHHHPPQPPSDKAYQSECCFRHSFQRTVFPLIICYSRYRLCKGFRFHQLRLRMGYLVYSCLQCFLSLADTLSRVQHLRLADRCSQSYCRSYQGERLPRTGFLRAKV